MRIGDFIEVIDLATAPFPMYGEVLDIDMHPFKESYAKIRVESPALQAPEIWVNLRLARAKQRSTS